MKLDRSDYQVGDGIEAGMNSHCTVTVIKMPAKISLMLTILRFEGSSGTLVRDKSQAAPRRIAYLYPQRECGFTTLMTLTYPIPDISMLRQPGGF